MIVYPKTIPKLLCRLVFLSPVERSITAFIYSGPPAAQPARQFFQQFPFGGSPFLTKLSLQEMCPHIFFAQPSYILCLLTNLLSKKEIIGVAE